MLNLKQAIVEACDAAPRHKPIHRLYRCISAGMKGFPRIVAIVMMLWVSGIYIGIDACASDSHYVIDSADADVRLLVYRQGALSLFGHNHVIYSTNTRGEIIHDKDNIEYSRFKLTLPVQGFVVDRPQDRQRSGKAFDNAVDEEAAQSTRTNLLSQQLLDAQKHPLIHIEGGISMNADSTISHIRIGIKGRMKDYTVPIVVQMSDTVITASGHFTASQTDFGLQPMSLMGGLLAVKDEFDVIFTIKAKKIE